MFNVYLDDGNIDVDNLDDICYIINGEGTFLRKKIGITDALIKVNNISHLKSSVSSFGKINIPVIPKDYTSKITKFFKWAYSEHNGEAVVLIYYNPELNDFDIFPTNQEVSGASASYIKEGLSHTGYLLVGTIHSHANFGASHSGIDNDDELNFDGVHITIGNVNDTYQSISCSVVVNGQRFMYDPIDYLDGIIKVQNDEKNSLNKKYLVTGLTFATFDEDWKDKVQKRIKTQFRNYDNVLTNHFSGFNNSFNYWDSNNIHGNLNSRSLVNQFNDNKSFAETEIPCKNCIYRDFKTTELLQEVFDQDEIEYLLGMDEDDLLENNEDDGTETG